MESRYAIRAVERALRILSVLSDGKPRSLKELSGEIGMNNSTTFRLLSTLASGGYVERGGRAVTYKLGIACLELARAYQESSDLRQVALQELEQLRDDTKETVHLAILDHMEVVYLEKFHGLHAIGIMSSQVGGRSPAYCTGLGKILLAYADQAAVRSYYEKKGFHRYSESTIADLGSLMRHLHAARDRGYALDLGEHEPEIHCIAAPIFDMNGSVVAAISLSGPTSRMKPIDQQDGLIARTLEAARSISKNLGYRQEGSRRRGAENLQGRV
jgi:DNA-binding IclR family transcriptional regulator